MVDTQKQAVDAVLNANRETQRNLKKVMSGMNNPTAKLFMLTFLGTLVADEMMIKQLDRDLRFRRELDDFGKEDRKK